MGDYNRREAIGCIAGGIAGLGMLVSDTFREAVYSTLDDVLRPSAAHAQPMNKFDELYGEKRTFKDAKEELGYLVQNFYMNPTRETADLTLSRINELVKNKRGQLKMDAESTAGIEPKYSKSLDLTKNKQYDKAIELLKECILIEPNNGEIYDQLGLNYVSKKSWKDASEAYRKAIKIDPVKSSNYYFLGRVAFMDENWIEAYFALKIMEILNPSESSRKKVAGLLAKINTNLSSD